VTELIRRVGTMGWLVLSGGMPSLGIGHETFMERLLTQVDLLRSPAVLHLPGGSESASEFAEELGALFSQPVEDHQLHMMEFEEIQAVWLEAPLLILADGRPVDWREIIHGRVFTQGSDEVIAPGAMLIAVGGAAAALGEWILEGDRGRLEAGLGWLPDAIVLPGDSRPGEREEVKRLLADQSLTYALGLPAEAIFALGPEQQVEVWSKVPPVISIGYTGFVEA
jgi:hypothetical protein